MGVTYCGSDWPNHYDLPTRQKRRMVRPERVEPPTFWSVAKRSIQLSYGRPEKNGGNCGPNRIRHTRKFFNACDAEFGEVRVAVLAGGGGPDARRTGDRSAAATGSRLCVRAGEFPN